MLAILLNVYLLAKPLSNNGSLANETICSINVGPLPSKNVQQSQVDFLCMRPALTTNNIAKPMKKCWRKNKFS